MNKQCIYVPFAVLVASLAACTATPQKDISGLNSGINIANAAISSRLLCMGDG